jgi:predicted TIM-barrel fold metal-dependent hydrolase
MSDAAPRTPPGGDHPGSLQAASTASPRPDRAPGVKPMVIDCHVHLNNYHEEVPIALDASLDRLQAAMAEAGVGYALVLTSYLVTPHRPSTAEVVRAIERIPTLGVVAGISYLHYKQRDLRELAEFLEAGLVRGLKLYPGYEPFYPHDRRLQVVYELAEEFDVPVMIHCGDTFNPRGKVKYAHPLEVDEVAVDHPGVKLVICHLGNPWLVDCMEVVYKNPGVYADISGLVLGEFTEAFEQYMAKQIEEVILYAGEPDRFLFGSDWPICSMRSYMDFVRQLRMPEADRHAMLYENARRLFKLPLPPFAPRVA